ncbi:MAG: nitrate reductase [Acidiphilium sp. 37-64-53]|uniref:NCS1 family nucleobase:cation symporter-1 n=1 Tax=Acidiphilium TaxID=522 RepID=UPI000BD6FC60|nr:MULTISPECIES: NCS1 family nucleobase:cation symporter-1 [Acidiphilium]OYV63287.1 MAG: nitrate reductase [Acidiphilium sp. 21-62-4]OYW02431.1 MAG: nitrate reductase [Acidiphilium sp. 37-64-53]OZB30218.1 MAG: nitrate reductase [Acidiphilium sp. 34-64-41]HQT84380.1 NCS1 family nucleobase:cation symporter-1 [Acidiphilium rubrum]
MTRATYAQTDLTNADLAPTTAAQRSWRWYHFVALWIGMVMCIPSYTLASSMIGAGMSWSEAVLTVFLGNLIVLAPMLLIGDAGARYGIPYAVLARASFGTTGARLPAMMRALVACGWYGIQTWFGGEMIYTLGGVLVGHPIGGAPIPVLGIDAAQLVCFLLFWAIELWYVLHGIEAIRKLETYTAPAKIVICALLLGWVYHKVGGFGPLLDKPSAFAAGGAKAGQFWAVFFPSLTAMVGFWATLALNIPDFTRFAKTRADQAIGQAIGLPVPMGLLAVFSVLVTSGTVVIYGAAIWDPVTLAGKMSGAAVLLALVFLLVDTISVNLAANLVGPAYDFSSLSPRHVSYRTGGMITAVIAIVMMPWKILASTHGYIFTWLIGYSALLGPIAGILIVDYVFIRNRRLDVAELYRANGRYTYRGGWNLAALAALILSILPNLPGFLNAAFPASFTHVAPLFVTLYTYSWFVGLVIASVIYAGLMWGVRVAEQREAAPALATGDAMR